jgi:hypothetical protein
MATLNFPTSPSLNDTYSFNNKTWVWNGLGWQLQASQGAINGLVIGNSTPAAGTFTALSATGNITGGNIDAAELSLSGDALIGGDLTINGNISYLNVDSFNVEDPIIGLGRSANNTPLIINDGKDRGTDLWYYTDAEKQAFVGYKNNTGKMFAATDVSITSEIVTVNSYGTFVVGGLEGASVSVTGNVIGGNILAGSGQFSTSGNVTGGNLIIAAAVSAASVSASGNVTGNYILGNGALLTGVITSVSNINNGTSNVSIATANANVTVSVDGTSNVAVFAATGEYITGIVSVSGNIIGANINGNGSGLSSITGANVTGQVPNALVSGTVYTAAQPNITSVGTLTSLSSSGNIDGANINGNGSGLSNITGANVTGQVGNALVAGTVYTAAQPNITSVGILTSLSSTGNIDGANINGNGSGLSSLNGANITGQVPNALVSGTVYTADQSNITSVGILTSLSSTGNVTGGNLITAGAVSAASISASGNVTGANIITAAAVSAASVSASGNVNSGNLISAALVQGATVSASANVIGGNVNTNTLTGTDTTIGSTGNINLSATGNIVLSTQTYINNLSTPVQNNDAATKQYVDDIAQGLHTHDSCNAATPTTLDTISSGTVTYNNGTSGVGATLTTTGTYTTIDGVTLSNGMRILVKNEANTAHNGIYDRTSATVLTRSTDFDTPAEMAGGDFTFVTAGTLYDNTGWVMTDPVTTVGTSPVPWVQFSGAGTYTAGTGLTLTGTEFSVNASQTQVTTVGTLGSLTVTANITGGNILTGGIISSTGNITGGNILGGANVNATTHTGTTVSVTGNITAGNLLISGAIVDSAQLDIQTSAANANIVLTPNGTGIVGVSTLLSVTGNTTGGNINTPGIFSGAGNVQAWSTTTPGLAVGGLHLGSASATTDAGPAITFGSRDATNGTVAQAGIYTNTGGGFGTRMYFATTDAYVTGSKVATSIDHLGVFYVNARNGTIAINNSGSNGVGNIGTATSVFNTVFAKATSAQYADVAEQYLADADYPPGTVLIFGGEQEVTADIVSHSTAIAGVVSENPSYLMNSGLQGQHVVSVALLGRVPCQVQGTIRKGDLLVASNSTGVAQRLDPAQYLPGCVIGKALANYSSAEVGTIEIAVGVK